MRLASVLMLSLSLATAGCSARPAGSAGGADSRRPTTAGVLAALRAAGVSADEAGRVEQPFFPVAAHVYRVDQGELQLYEFPNDTAAEDAASRVSPDGGSIAGSSMHWIAPPHFFHRGSLIVNYLGTSAVVLNELEKQLGPQFAGR